MIKLSRVAERPRKKFQPGPPDIILNLDGWQEKETMFTNFVQRLWREEEGQDIAEYAVMLAVILVIVVGTVRLIGSSANTVFSSVASSIQ